ncbi:uncharacterized protein [Parasteatoda tepidariorum]|uniref:uncharacterized protein n=1 Tax=Parasteatoda tepidariorum TaxID=114398 RepID=UPI00077FC4B2|nr:uncharacterized protein LOC107447216 [Parasteatoda tepidariorum]
MYSYCNILLTVGIFILTQISLGTSIECYNCRSDVDSNCAAEHPDPKFLTNCSALKEGPKYQACRRIENFVDFTVVGQEPTKRVIRQCAADVDKERPCYYRAGFGGRSNVCDCFQNKCNYASTIINSVLVTAICAFAAFIFL